MKILKLDLRAVGPFTDKVLDLSAGHCGLHVIVGPNEAGKSSALRALRHLLYGFPNLVTEDFVHEKTQVRVGATLLHSDGKTELTVYRRRGRVETLLDNAGKAVPDGSLLPFLGSVDPSQFQTFFGIDHAALRQGGEDILSGGATLSESLFAAGSGGPRLRQLLQGIERRSEELYKAGGSKPFISSKLREHREALELVGQRSGSVKEWSEHDQNLSKARLEVEQVKTEIVHHSTELHRLQRLSQALPLLAQRRAILEAILAMVDVPKLPEDFSETRRKATTSLTEASASGIDLEQQINQVDAQLSEIIIPPGLIGHAEMIETLQGELAIYRRQLDEVPALEARCAASKQDAADILRDVRPDLNLDQADQLHVSTARDQQVQALSLEHGKLTEKLRQADKTLRQKEIEKHETIQTIGTLPVELDCATLEVTLATALQSGNIEQQFSKGDRDLAQSRHRADADLKKLGLWSGSLDAVESLAVPLDQSIEQARGQMEKCTGEQDSERAGIRKLEKKLREIDRKIAELSAAGNLPTDGDLHAARAHRQKGWSLVLRAWLGIEAPDIDPATFIGEASLDVAYAQSVAQTDELADQLRAESTRVADLANARAERRETEEELQRQRLHLIEIEKWLAEIETDWIALWLPLDITPRSPQEMTGWVNRQRELSQQARAIRELTFDQDQLRQQIEHHRKKLADTLFALGEKANEVDSLGMLQERAKAMIKQIREQAELRHRLLTDLARCESGIKSAEAEKKSVERELSDWKMRWSPAVAGVVAENAEPSVAIAMLRRIEMLFQKLREIKTAETQLAASTTQLEHFAQRARELTERLAGDILDLIHLPVDQAIVTLGRRLKQAREDQLRKNQLLMRRQELQLDRARVLQKVEQAKEDLQNLCRLAGCETAQQLAQRERLFQQWKEKADLQNNLEEKLLLLANGQTLQQLMEQASALDADALQMQIAELTSKVEQLNDHRQKLGETIGAEEGELRKWDGNGLAGEAAERAAGILADLRDAAGEYARLKLAAGILKRGIERYGQRKRGPVLSHASQLFSTLTLGSFKGLEADYDEHDKQVLVGVRADGKHANVKAMSDGTRDQLYLALRLATLSEYVGKKCEPIPFIVDDILVHFDDQRAAATLKVLCEIARSVQVILFTHHPHIADLAGKAGDDVHVCRL